MTKKEENAFSVIMQAAKDLGWVLALPDVEGEDTIGFLVIGNEQSIDDLADDIPIQVFEPRLNN